MEFDESAETCCCGNLQQIVNKIHGRQVDFLYTAEKGKINSGNLSNIFRNMPNSMIRTQLQQKELGKVTAFLEIDKEKYLPEYDEILKEEFSKKFGLTTKLEVVHVDEIPREVSGKFRMVKCSVKF